jgi:hypothetical protein
MHSSVFSSLYYYELFPGDYPSLNNAMDVQEHDIRQMNRAYTPPHEIRLFASHLRVPLAEPRAPSLPCMIAIADARIDLHRSR